MDISSKLINGMPWPLGYVKLLDTFDWEIAHNSHLFGILIPTIMSVHDIDTVIEIGIDRAWVTHVAARTMIAIGGGGTILSCDIRSDCCENARRQTEGLPIKHLVREQDSAEILWSRYHEFDANKPVLCVVDGDHRPAAALIDFEQCDKVCPEGSFILAHDFGRDIRGAADRFMTDSSSEWTYVIFKDNSPTALLQKGEPK